MTGIILAAGVGSRLRPLTETCPKCLLPVGSEGLLPRTLRALQAAGIAECVLVTGHLRAMVEDAVHGMRLSMPVRFVHNHDFETTNNNASLWLAGTVTGRSDILVLDSDILFDHRLLPLLLSSTAPNALLMREDGNLGREEIKVIVENGRVLQIGKEVEESRAVGESIGIEKFSADTARTLFSTLERRRTINEFYEASFQEIIDGGANIAAVPTQGLPCMEIDTSDDLAAATKMAAALGI